MNISSRIRQLARTSYWQNIYKHSQECHGIKLFENENNFSGLQVEFLHWLAVYSMLYEELGKHEDDLLTEKVIENTNRCDAYLYHRRKKIDYDWKKYQDKIRQDEINSRRKRKFSEGNRTDINVQLRRK